MNDKLVRLSDVETELLKATERYTVAHEARGTGTVVWSDNLVSIGNALNAVRSIPAVDAVPMDFHDRCMQIEIRKRMEVERSRPEVVRCGDCVHLNGEFGNMSGNFRCDVFDAWQKDTERAYMPLDGFCYLGQRREDGDA